MIATLIEAVVTRTGKTAKVEVIAQSPTGQRLTLPVANGEGQYNEIKDFAVTRARKLGIVYTEITAGNPGSST
ncbi:hypothetical protein A2721_01570 [Candidatus Gottesmanbacteria bacterium RIFCSPHIGHO2_01_FULL_47_48]|uniref:Uncharacterized protein n=1 Tax=Candidatus Gottesmanbacteria bacterium RIFCSPHIGHO2_01_FULL_47_48 TaxID=1798381 RepID=A0A1F6A285_9BACT|nr:MAG: hypothetical protein A2721_01570 [Candidatus Gottesmanbacteria bacterium RIFCSPHIGHO2_01_FULL_47_48]